MAPIQCAACLVCAAAAWLALTLRSCCRKGMVLSFSSCYPFFFFCLSTTLLLANVRRARDAVERRRLVSHEHASTFVYIFFVYYRFLFFVIVIDPSAQEFAGPARAAWTGMGDFPASYGRLKRVVYHAGCREARDQSCLFNFHIKPSCACITASLIICLRACTHMFPTQVSMRACTICTIAASTCART